MEKPFIEDNISLNQLLTILITYIREFNRNNRYYDPFTEDMPYAEKISRLFRNKRNINEALSATIAFDNITQANGFFDNEIDFDDLIKLDPNIRSVLISFIEIIEKYNPLIRFDHSCKALLDRSERDSIDPKSEELLCSVVEGYDIDMFKWETPILIDELKSAANYFFQFIIAESDLQISRSVSLYDFVNNFIVGCLFFSGDEIGRYLIKPYNSTNPLVALSRKIYDLLNELQCSKGDVYEDFINYEELFPKENTLRMPRNLIFNENILGISVPTASGQTVTFRLFDTSFANQLSKRFHMMHSIGGGVQKYSFGAFIDDSKIPYIYATLNEADVDKSYVQAICGLHQINPRNLLEISRSWSHSNTPKYHLGFFYAMLTILIQKVQTLGEYNPSSSNLQGLYTTINPNIGFRANAYRGNGYKIVGQRPSGFNYVVLDGIAVPSYLVMGRDQYQQSTGKFEGLPNNVLLKRLDNQPIRGNIILDKL
jgi:hypothetical protein